jgi:hypothetical protein
MQIIYLDGKRASTKGQGARGNTKGEGARGTTGKWMSYCSKRSFRSSLQKVQTATMLERMQKLIEQEVIDYVDSWSSPNNGF